MTETLVARVRPAITIRRSLPELDYATAASEFSRESIAIAVYHDRRVVRAAESGHSTEEAIAGLNGCGQTSGREGNCVAGTYTSRENQRHDVAGQRVEGCACVRGRKSSIGDSEEAAGLRDATDGHAVYEQPSRIDCASSLTAASSPCHEQSTIAGESGS